MKNKNSFIFKGLISLMLSLVMICGTAVTSLSAVTDQVVAAVKEPVRSAIPDAPAPAQATDETDIPTQSDSALNASDYGVVEGSMLEEPADDEVLDISLDDDTPAEDSSATLTLSREKNIDLAATGAEVISGNLDHGTTYYIGSDDSIYHLIYSNSGWQVFDNTKTRMNYYNITSNSWTNSGTPLSADVATNNGVVFSYTQGWTTYYLTFENNAIGYSHERTYVHVYNPNAPTPTVAPTQAPTQPTTEPVTPTEAPSESTSSDSITYTKQIEKKNPDTDDDYNYRLHLSVDGSKLKETTTTTSNKKVGIAILIDMAGDQRATWGNDSYGRPIYKKDVIRQYINKYLSAYKNVANVNISIIAVKGTQSQPYNDPSVTNILSEWDEYKEIDDTTYTNNTITYGANYTAGLIRAQEYLTDKTKNGNKEFDYNSIVFITNQNPLFGALDNGNYDSSQGTGSEGFAKDNVLSYLDRVYIPEYTTNLHIIDVPNENSTANHTTPVAMSDKLIAAKRGSFTSATSASDLDTAIGNAIESILAGDKTKSLTVSDTLSANVDFASNNNLTATLYTGANLATQNEVSGAVTIDGKTVTFDQSKLAQISGLSSLAEIDGPFKLEIAFDIKTIVSGQSYPDTGDADTDYSSATYNYNYSANKPGYYANSSATISYTLNGTAKSDTFIKPVVQAPAETPVQGKYIFQYTDRFGDTQEVTVPVILNNREKTGYSGNGGQAGVPTFLWTDDAKTLYNNINPLVKAALALEGNEEMGGDNWQKDASVYKCDLVWDNLTAISQGTNVSYNTTEHSVTIEATTTPYKFKLLYYTVNGSTATLQGTASELEYGKAVTFNPIYSGSSEYAYVEYTVPSNGFSYWSADPEGAIPITTNLTYGMIMRGDYMHDNDDDRTVHIYAQYNKAPDKLWNPLIEEAKLTHTIDDDHDWVYLDYMTNYLSKDGTVVQEMEVKPEYGIVVAKYDSTRETLSQETMQSVAKSMIEKDKSSAYLDKGKTAIAYRFKYNDNEHISDFNRTLYTLKSDTSEADNKRFTAIAYIVVDDVKYYSLINTDITVIDLV